MKTIKKSLSILGLSFILITGASAQNYIYKPASLTKPAVNLQKVEGAHLERFTKPYEIQRLSENVYGVSASYYNVSVVVGEKGVLLIDAPIMRGERILQAIQQITKKPVTALAYSHSHKDHLGGAASIIKASKNKITIYATKEVKEELLAHHMDIPAPTKLLSNKLHFEGIKIDVGSGINGHTEDNTTFIIRDGNRRIIHAVDLVHPDQLEFKDFSLSHDVVKYQTDLNILMELEWDVMVTGHGNLAYKQDVQFILKYISDAKAALGQGFGKAKFENSIKPGSPYAWFEGYKEDVVNIALEIFSDKYRSGREEEFDLTAKTHLEGIFWSMYTR